MKSALTHEDVFIMAKSGHATVVTMNYQDDYALGYLGDVWLLPTKKCHCGLYMNNSILLSSILLLGCGATESIDEKLNADMNGNDL